MEQKRRYKRPLFFLAQGVGSNLGYNKGMPWEIKKRGSKWVVVKKGTTRVYGTHDTRQEAVAQLRALYASEAEKGRRK